MGYTKRLTINEKSYVVVSWSEVTFSDIEHI